MNARGQTMDKQDKNGIVVRAFQDKRLGMGSRK
jgi:hypothetical protein